MSTPTTLDALAGYKQECECQKVHQIDTQLFILSPGAISDVADVVRQFCLNGTVGVVTDRILETVAANSIVKQLSDDNQKVLVHIAPDGPGERPHATYENVLDVQRQLATCDVLVAVGSGTVNDLAKLASYWLGIPYIVFPTAASMNGYTSAIAAIMKDGLKQTIDCHQPVAVVADVSIISKAPKFLARSGLGDLESKPVCSADFLLSSLLRNTYYCEVPLAVVSHAEKNAAMCAEGIGKGDVESIKVLTEALLLSGCSMKLAGSSSPASGGEHLISHYWDMNAEKEHRVEGFHGAQVGVTTILMAALYETLQQVNPRDIDIESLVTSRPSKNAYLKEIALRHGEYGALAAAEMEQKWLSEAAYTQQLEYIVSNFEQLWSQLTMLKSSESIRGVLKKAGAPTTIGELELTKAHLQAGYRYAREIRGRFTVLDFAAEIGVLEQIHSNVLSLSRTLG